MSEVIGAEIRLKVDNALAALKEIGDAGSAAGKDVARELSKNLKAAEKAAKDAAKATKGVGDAAKDFGDKAGKAGQNAAKLSGALDLIVPGGGEAVRTLADLADVGEVLTEVSIATGVSISTAGVALVAVAQAAAVAYVAWRVYSEEGDRAAATAKSVAAAQIALEPILRSTAAATIDLKEHTGELSEEQAALARNSTKAHEALQKATEATRKEQLALRKEQGGLLVQGVDLGHAMYESIGLAWTPMAVAFDGLTTSSSELQEQINGLETANVQASDATRENTQITGEIIEIKIAAKGATNELRRAEVDLTGELLKQSAAALASAAAFDARLASVEAAAAAADGIVQDSGDFQRAEAERLALARDADIAAYVQKAQDGAKDLNQIEAGKAEIAANYQEKITQAIAKEAEARSLKLTEEAEKAAAAQAAQDAQQIAATADLFGSIASIAGAAREGMSEDSKEAALALFAVQKAAGIAQAGINAVLAVSEASTLPFPVNIAAAAAAVGIGIANVASVASVAPPTFNDTPGVQKMGVSGTVKLGADDYFAAARDPDELRRQVNGATDPHADYRTGGPTVSVIGPRAFGRRIRDDVRLRTPLARAIFQSSGGSVGQKGRG